MFGFLPRDALVVNPDPGYGNLLLRDTTKRLALVLGTALGGGIFNIPVEGDSPTYGTVTLDDGATATPTLNFASSLTTGLSSPAGNVLAFSANALESFRVNPDQSLSIGTIINDGVNKLQVTGDSKFTGNVVVTGTITGGGGIVGPVISGATITTSTIDSSVIGGVTPAAATFTTLNTTGIATVGDGTIAASLVINGAAGTVRGLRYQTTGANRWQVLAGNVAETGSNAGSNFLVNAYDDSGTLIDSPLTISRAASGFVVLGGTTRRVGIGSTVDDGSNRLQVTGNTLLTGDLSITGSTALVGGTIDGTVIGGTTPAAGTFTTLTTTGNLVGTVTQNVYNTVSTTVNAFGAASVLSLGAVTGTTTVNNALIQATGNVLIGSSVLGAGSAISIRTAAGQTRQLIFQTGAALARWAVQTDGVAEGGSDAGSGFRINAYDDTGALIDAPMVVTRAAAGGIILGGSSARAVTLTGSIIGAITQSVFNSTSTTINAFGAATTINMGAALSTLNLSSATVLIGTNAGTSAQLSLNAAAGTTRQWVFRSGGVGRWSIAANNSTESGSDTGSNFTLQALNDAGAGIDLPITVARASAGAILLGGTSLRPVTLTGALVGPATAAVFNTVSTTVNAFGAATAVNIGASTGTTTINNPTLQVGGNALAAAAQIIVNSAAAQVRAFQIKTGGVLRWRFGGNSAAESGSDAGTNFFLEADSDAGAAIDSPILINRASGGVITLGGTSARGIQLTGAIVGQASQTVFNTVSTTVNAFGSATALNMGGTSGVFAMRIPTTSLGIGTATACTLNLNSAAATVRKIGLLTAGLSRWTFQADATAEGGSDAGSNYGLTAYNDAGAAIDNPLTIARVSAGAIVLGGSSNRPTTFTGTSILFPNITTSLVAPAAGAAAALPATPAGYATLSIGGTDRQVAYY